LVATGLAIRRDYRNCREPAQSGISHLAVLIWLIEKGLNTHPKAVEKVYSDTR